MSSSDLPVTVTYMSLATLAAEGITRAAVRRLIGAGLLLRVRKGRYVDTTCPAPFVDAARLGGRLDCVSLLATLGVFVRDQHGPLHIQIEAGSSRVPPRDARVRAHWRSSQQGRHDLAADVIEALAQACRCQPPRDAVATLDSAWHLGIVDDAGIAAVFRLLPRRFAVLRPLLEPRAEAGTESLVRLLIRTLGHHVEVQVQIDGVGRVDMLVDGWLIVECDSRAHHATWEDRKRDMRRDVASAALGYTTVRPLAEDILASPDQLTAVLRRILAHCPNPNSSGSRRKGT